MRQHKAVAHIKLSHLSHSIIFFIKINPKLKLGKTADSPIASLENMSFRNFLQMQIAGPVSTLVQIFVREPASIPPRVMQ